MPPSNFTNFIYNFLGFLKKQPGYFRDYLLSRGTLLVENFFPPTESDEALAWLKKQLQPWKELLRYLGATPHHFQDALGALHQLFLQRLQGFPQLFLILGLPLALHLRNYSNWMSILFSLVLYLWIYGSLLQNRPWPPHLVNLLGYLCLLSQLSPYPSLFVLTIVIYFFFLRSFMQCFLTFVWLLLTPLLRKFPSLPISPQQGTTLFLGYILLWIVDWTSFFTFPHPEIYDVGEEEYQILLAEIQNKKK